MIKQNINEEAKLPFAKQNIIFTVSWLMSKCPLSTQNQVMFCHWWHLVTRWHERNPKNKAFKCCSWLMSKCPLSTQNQVMFCHWWHLVTRWHERNPKNKAFKCCSWMKINWFTLWIQLMFFHQWCLWWFRQSFVLFLMLSQFHH